MTSHKEYNTMRSYIQGRMSADEEQAFETQMHSDAFLADAVEGFLSDPGAINDIPSQSRYSKLWLYSIAGLGLICLLLFVTAEVIFIQNIEEDVVEEIVIKSRMESRPKPIRTPQATAVLPDKEFTIEPIREPEVIITEPDLLNIEAPRKVNLVAHPIKIVEAPNITITSSEMVMQQSEIIYIEELKVVKEERLNADKDNLFSFHERHLPAFSEQQETPLSILHEKYLSQFEKTSYKEFLRTALIDFKKGNYQKSHNAFANLNAEYGKSINHLFYMGLCAFHLEKYELAANDLSAVRYLRDRAFYEEATWYYALSLQAMGKKSKAKKLFEEIYKGDGHYAPMAASRLIGL